MEEIHKIVDNFSEVVYLVVLDAAQALDDGYPEEEEESNAGPSENQHPGHVRLCRAVRVRVAWRDCLKHKDRY